MASEPRPATRTLSEADFTAPIDDRYFEDYTPGAVYEYGYATITEDEIREFALRFAPQRIHTDPAFAATGPFGGLIASGWHTAGIMMRLFADHYLSTVAGLASPGIDELRWPNPLRPGGRLFLRTEIVEIRPPQSKPDRALVPTRADLINQDDLVTLRLLAVSILARRSPD